jgi:hypothetical protein
MLNQLRNSKTPQLLKSPHHHITTSPHHHITTSHHKFLIPKIHQNPSKQGNECNQHGSHPDRILDVARKGADFILQVGVFGINLFFHFGFVEDMDGFELHFVLYQYFVRFQYFHPKINVEKEHSDKEPDYNRNQ